MTGFNTFNTNNLRLWRSRPFFDEVNSESDNSQESDDNESVEDLVDLIDKLQDSEYLTSVYYPNIPG